MSVTDIATPECDKMVAVQEKSQEHRGWRHRRVQPQRSEADPPVRGASGASGHRDFRYGIEDWLEVFDPDA